MHAISSIYQLTRTTCELLTRKLGERVLDVNSATVEPVGE
jgi:hypothetical protein